MNDMILQWVISYGAIIVFATTFLSCLAMPVPSSLMMLSGGAFAASGDIALTTVAFAAYGGAIAGDQAGFAVGKKGSGWLKSKIHGRPKRAEMFQKAHDFTHNWGGGGVFLSRWLLSPLGPYVNFAGGIVEMPWLRFAIWAALGEVVWVAIYVGLGFTFAEEIAHVATFLGHIIGLLTGLAVTIGLGVALKRAHAKAPVEPVVTVVSVVPVEIVKTDAERPVQP